MEPRIVQAVAVACGRHDAQNPLTRVVEAAMVKAIEAALAEGITDQDVIRERIQAARDEAL